MDISDKEKSAEEFVKFLNSLGIFDIQDIPENHQVENHIYEVWIIK